MTCNYVVTAYKPTSVTSVLTGNFTGESKLNLILVRGNNLAVYEVTPEGLKSVVDASVRGRISLAKLIRPQVSKYNISN
jgi:DNA damage-binding protein 1